MPIVIENLSYTYHEGSSLEMEALKGVNLVVEDGEFLGIIGPTGSGKSTLVQHFNGLIRPTSGKVVVDGIDLSDRRANLKEIRQRVGLVFQYPEHQLFEETVYDDIAFGPRNLNLPEKEVHLRVEEAMAAVGLAPELASRSPFELSGGQMRRVALAGVLAMRPRILVLDEPTAGLDPRGRDEILGYIRRLYQTTGITVILVSHSMDDVASLAERIVVMADGQIVLTGTPRQVFASPEVLRSIGLDIPRITELMHQLRIRGKEVRVDIITLEEARSEIIERLRDKGHVQ